MNLDAQSHSRLIQNRQFRSRFQSSAPSRASSAASDGVGLGVRAMERESGDLAEPGHDTRWAVLDAGSKLGVEKLAAEAWGGYRYGELLLVA